MAVPNPKSIKKHYENVSYFSCCINLKLSGCWLGENFRVMKQILFLLPFISNYVIVQIPELQEQVSPLLIGEQISKSRLKSDDNKTVELNKSTCRKTNCIDLLQWRLVPLLQCSFVDIQLVEKESIGLVYQIVTASPDSSENLKITEKDKSNRYQLYSDASGQFIKDCIACART